MLRARWRLIALPVLVIGCAPVGVVQAATLIQSQVCSSPPPLTISSPRDQSTTTASSVTVNGQAETGATISILDNGVVTATNTVPQSGNYSVSSQLTMGDNKLQINMSDSCGSTLSSNSLTVIRIAPTAILPDSSPPMSLAAKLTQPIKRVVQAINAHRLAGPPAAALITPSASPTPATPTKSVTVIANEVVTPPVYKVVSSKAIVVVAGTVGVVGFGYLWIAGKLSISKIGLWFK